MLILDKTPPSNGKLYPYDKLCSNGTIAAAVATGHFHKAWNTNTVVGLVNASSWEWSGCLRRISAPQKPNTKQFPIAAHKPTVLAPRQARNIVDPNFSFPRP
jgi:hypothetical protein